MSAAIDRKAAVRAYREERRPAGIYRVRCTVTGREVVGSTPDLPSMLRRQRFTLETGAHPDKALQTDWNEHGEAAFQIEVLDTLELPDDPAYDAREDLAELLGMWRERLAGETPESS